MIVSRSFYIEHRMAVGYARYNLDEKIPKFNTREEWEEKKSTKMDTCARLCQYLLSRDDTPEVSVVAGQLILPPLPPLPEGEKPQQTIKVLISQEFPSLAPLLRNVSASLFLFRRRCLRCIGFGSLWRWSFVDRWATVLLPPSEDREGIYG